MFLLLAVNLSLWAEEIPEWLAPLREAVYEQKLNAAEVKPLYRNAREAARRRYSDTALDLALSRCEYFMGRALQYEEINNEASVHYAEGMRLAEKAVAAAPSDVAWQMLAENLSQNCAVRGVSYALANGLNVDKYAKNALAMNTRNAAAQHLIAARWVYAPAPLHNHKKGIEMMKAILAEGDMGKDDRFNVNLAIGYAYIQQKNYAEAKPWLLKAQEVYPANKYVAQLLEIK